MVSPSIPLSFLVDLVRSLVFIQSDVHSSLFFFKIHVFGDIGFARKGYATGPFLPWNPLSHETQQKRSGAKYSEGGTDIRKCHNSILV